LLDLVQREFAVSGPHCCRNQPRRCHALAKPAGGAAIETSIGRNALHQGEHFGRRPGDTGLQTARARLSCTTPGLQSQLGRQDRETPLQRPRGGASGVGALPATAPSSSPALRPGAFEPFHELLTPVLKISIPWF